nr:hypothetical protein [Candidatus Sigynarchaeum springense]
MAERLEQGIVHEILRAEKPSTVQQLVIGINKRTNASTKDVVALLRDMERSGALKTKRVIQPAWPRWFQDLLGRFPFLKSFLFQYMAEPLIKAMSIIIVFNAISWLTIIAFQTNVALAPFRIIFHGIDLFFLPGFALTILWYPFPSTQLDFTKLIRKSTFNKDHAARDRGHERRLDIPTRVAYSMCYSIGLVIIAGFLIGILGFGFNIIIMHGLFTVIELLVMVVMIVKIYKIKDPYLHI